MVESQWTSNKHTGCNYWNNDIAVALSLFGNVKITHKMSFKLYASVKSSTYAVDNLFCNVILSPVRYLPCLGSQAAIMFLASNICWVSSGTVRALEHFRFCFGHHCHHNHWSTFVWRIHLSDYILQDNTGRIMSYSIKVDWLSIGKFPDSVLV